MTVAQEGDHVVVTIDNPGPYTGPRPGGHGVEMVRRRLALEGDPAAGFTLEQVQDDPPRTRATVRLPAG